MLFLGLPNTGDRLLMTAIYLAPSQMDLSKAFDRMPHGLLIAKLHAYGLSDDACTMVISYLKDRHQRVKVMGEFSYCTTINRDVPQGSVMGALSFNIFLNDLFYVDMNYDIANYADDNHLYYANSCTITLKNVLENDTRALLGLKIITWMATLTNFSA